MTRTVLLFAAMALGVLLASGVALPAGPLYPDLITLKPSHLIFDTARIDGTSHVVLRFSNRVWNAGEGPLELRAQTVQTTSGKKTRVRQRIYDDTGGYTSRNAGYMIYHPSHKHFHFEDFARYELWTRAEYNTWLASGRSEGQAQRRGTKTTFCLMDTAKREDLAGSPNTRVYSRCGQTLQGLSVGWADKYGYFLPDQWIDLGRSKLANGQYVLRSVTDPKNRLHESAHKHDASRESGRANEAVTFFSVRAGTITITK